MIFVLDDIAVFTKSYVKTVVLGVYRISHFTSQVKIKKKKNKTVTEEQYPSLWLTLPPQVSSHRMHVPHIWYLVLVLVLTLTE